MTTEERVKKYLETCHKFVNAANAKAPESEVMGYAAEMKIIFEEGTEEEQKKINDAFYVEFP